MDFNSYWYLGLGVISLLVFLYAYIKTKSKQIFLLFLAMVGIGYIIEAVIYIFLQSYHYYPHLIKDDPYYDSNTGAIASNFLALPISAVFLAVFRKGWFWIVAFIGLFAGIEWLFLKLSIYKHNWWKTEYTSAGLPFYYLFAKLLHQKLLKPVKGVWHFFLLNLIIGSIVGTLHLVTIMLFNNRYYRPGWFEMVSHDTTAFGVVYYLLLTLLLVTLSMAPIRLNWLKYMIAFIFICTATFILSKVGILHSLVWWDRFYYLFLPLIILKLTTKISNKLLIGIGQ